MHGRIQIRGGDVKVFTDITASAPLVAPVQLQIKLHEAPETTLEVGIKLEI